MAELDAQIAAWTRRRDRAPTCSRVLDEHGVPAGRIFTAPDMLTDPQYLAREMVLRLPSTQGWDVPMTGVVPKFSRTPGGVRRAGPRLGADTDAVLRELAGVSDAEVERLRTGGVV